MILSNRSNRITQQIRAQLSRLPDIVWHHECRTQSPDRLKARHLNG